MHPAPGSPPLETPSPSHHPLTTPLDRLPPSPHPQNTDRVVCAAAGGGVGAGRLVPADAARLAAHARPKGPGAGRRRGADQRPPPEARGGVRLGLGPDRAPPRPPPRAVGGAPCPHHARHGRPGAARGRLVFLFRRPRRRRRGRAISGSPPGSPDEPHPTPTLTPARPTSASHPATPGASWCGAPTSAACRARGSAS
jgi:hypothetical protein